MTIDGIGYGSMGAKGAGDPREVERPGGRDASGASRQTQQSQPRSDSVEISAQARELASGDLSSEQIEAYRSKIAEGTYDRPGVAEDVARRILASGDVI